MLKKTRIVWFVLMIVIMIVIFIFSNQSGETSHAISNAVAESVNIEGNQWQEASAMPLAFGLNLRNWAHIGLYAFLGFATVMWIWSWWGASLICYGYACFDEFHQLFVGSRGASITDTFLDGIGFGVVILIWLATVRIIRRRNEGNTVRIAMLGHKRIPSREGGIEIVVDELSTRMAALGHSVTAYNRKGRHVSGGKVHKLKEYKGVKIKEVFTIDKKGFAALTSSFFACIRAGFGEYDVVHIHAEGPAFFSFIPKILGKKVVVTVHGLDWNRAKWGKFASWYIRTGEKNAVRFSDEIIVLSQGVKDYFWNTYKRKTQFVPNGVNRPVVREVKEIEKFGLEKDSYVLYLGRIVPEKGEHYLIKAWKELETDKKLVIAGGISDTAGYGAELKGLATGDDRIIFTGFVQGRKLEELYSNSLIYCLPSDLEGMPLSLLEAMSYGNCCVVSDIPECAEVVEDKAVTFKKSDVKDLKEKLEMLLRDREAVDKYKCEAADFICNKYSWDDVVEATLELYK